MAVPFFVQHNERTRVYKQRRLLEDLTDFEVRKHTGLPWLGARALLDWLEPFVEPQSFRNNAATAETKVLTALAFYRSGSFQWLLGTSSGTSQPSCSRYIEEVSNILVQEARRMIHFPSTVEETNPIKQAFFDRSGIRNVIGIVDGTHINIQAPWTNEPSYVNRKLNHSINTQVITDHRYLITDIVAKWPGSCHDSFIFRNSGIFRRFEQGEFGNGVLLGDSGYSRTRYLLTPYGRRILNEDELHFNIALKTVRSAVERCIGIWKSRFRRIHRTGGDLAYSPRKTCKIIVSTAVLHNFCISHDIPLEDEDMTYMNEVVLHEMREDAEFEANAIGELELD